MTVPPPSSLPTARTVERTYRKAKPLPVPLLDSCSIWLEEQLYSQAFSLLTSTLTSGTGTCLEALIAPPQHLALAATLIVHPLLTTRTTSPDKKAAADDALRYLQHVNSLLGAQESGLSKAFQFVEEPGGSRGKRARARVSEVNSDEEDDPGRLTSAYVGKESLWSNAEDFWRVVGWAFNCSVAHRHRWDRWKFWLGFMIDVLQDDLEDRLPEAEKVYDATQNTAAIEAMLEDTLLAQYLLPIGEGRNNKRRLMRALLADGKQRSLAEFGEVWKGETKRPKEKKDDRASKRRKLDVENGEYGDYYEDSDDESLANSIRRSRSTTAVPSAQASRAASRAVSGDEQDGDDDDASAIASSDLSGSSAAGIDSIGGIDALHLRQRILALLLLYCSKNPESFLDTEDLFDLYTEFLRPLPLDIFRHFVLPAKPWLGPNSQASLNQMLLRPLLVAAAPAYNENQLTQADFEVYYAPFAANNTSSVDNAKVGLLIESLLRLLWGAKQLVVTHSLRKVIQQGINARQEKAVFDGRKKVGEKMRAEEAAHDVMKYSAERMMAVLDMASEP